MYNHKEIEKKWQGKWMSDGLYRRNNEEGGKKKFYILDMFPYPSGDGLHMGHTESYTASDIYYRFKRMQGFDVLHPQGFDSFGLPAENYAIKTGIHPVETTKKNTDNYINQMRILGLGHDLGHLVYTSDPSYYRWTQFLFGKFFENNLVERKTETINWCPSCNTGIANEQVEDGKCERCKTEIEQKEIPGWFFKITDFAEDLINDLDSVDWPEHTKKNQKAWIGKSEGALLKFQITSNKSQTNSNDQNSNNQTLEVFTTRPDTLFGATYMVIAPEHSLIIKLESSIENLEEIKEYQEKTKKKTEMERIENKEKTGVKIKGIKAINPATNEEIPIFIADYVLAGYGTGAIMAVPAHDERDMEFALKYNVPIKQVVAPNLSDYQDTSKTLEALAEIIKEANKQGLKFWVFGGLACIAYANIIYRKHDDLDIIVKTKEDFLGMIEVFEKLNFKKEKEKYVREDITNIIFKSKDGIEVEISPYSKSSSDLKEIDFEDGEKQIGSVPCRVVSKKFMIDLKKQQMKTRGKDKDKIDLDYLNGKTFIEDGFNVNSGDFDGQPTEEAKKSITDFVGGELTVNYRLRDWSISRQRYWGCPIPIVYSPEGEAKYVGDENLPWTLPEDVDFIPTGTAPLAKSKELKARTEKLFGQGWTPEIDTMDTFVDSSWYFLRYPDTENEKEFCSKEKLKRWLPVDLYIGGAEHTYMHLLYARFFVKAMNKIGLVDFREPFLKLRHQGMVLDKNGVKMSKSKGNVINPNDMVEKFGADATRMYMMFAGPLEDDVIWNEDGVVGISRFLEKVWSLSEKKKKTCNCDGSGNCPGVPAQMPRLFHKTIKKVGEDIEKFRFNTAISEMMILVNYLVKMETIPDLAFELLLKILAPFAPHITEELWEKIGKNESIFKEEWPSYNPDLARDTQIELIVQVNGKVRAKINADAEIEEDEAKKLALENENVKKWIEGKEILKVVFVKGRLVSIVTKQ